MKTFFVSQVVKVELRFLFQKNITWKIMYIFILLNYNKFT